MDVVDYDKAYRHKTAHSERLGWALQPQSFSENRSLCSKRALFREKPGSENKAKVLGFPLDGKPYATAYHPTQGAGHAPQSDKSLRDHRLSTRP